MEQTQQRNSQNVHLPKQNDSLARKKRPKEDILEISQGYDISKAIIVDPFTEEYTEELNSLFALLK